MKEGIPLEWILLGFFPLISLWRGYPRITKACQKDPGTLHYWVLFDWNTNTMATLKKTQQLQYSPNPVYFLRRQRASLWVSRTHTLFDWYLLTQNFMLTDRWTGRQQWLHPLGFLCPQTLTPFPYTAHVSVAPARQNGSCLSPHWCWKIIWWCGNPPVSRYSHTQRRK